MESWFGDSKYNLGSDGVDEAKGCLVQTHSSGDSTYRPSSLAGSTGASQPSCGHGAASRARPAPEEAYPPSASRCWREWGWRWHGQRQRESGWRSQRQGRHGWPRCCEEQRERRCEETLCGRREVGAPRRNRVQLRRLMEGRDGVSQRVRQGTAMERVEGVMGDLKTFLVV